MAALTPDQVSKIAEAANESIESLVACWDSKKKSQDPLQVGQIVYAPVFDTEFRPKVAEVTRSDPQSHNKAEFLVRGVDDSIDFRSKPSRLPIAALNLGQTEEMMLIKGKQRPCVIIAKTDDVDISTLPAGAQKNKAQSAFSGLYCLAPLFSCSSGVKLTSFGPVMGLRIKCMMYPEFIYAPRVDGILEVDSIVRLDRLFWSYLRFGTSPKPLHMSDAMLAIAWDQIHVLGGIKPSDNYIELRELLMGEIPAECR